MSHPMQERKGWTSKRLQGIKLYEMVGGEWLTGEALGGVSVIC